MAGVNAYDVIVLDWLLPDKEGIDVCRDLRARGVATNRSSCSPRDIPSKDRVIGLNTGADDYHLVKSFRLCRAAGSHPGASQTIHLTAAGGLEGR
jgi:DNA-binding response OmpR family regulator